MQLNLETNYAVQITDTLSRQWLTSGVTGESRRLDAATIAERANVPQPFALKILRKLTSGGIVKSYKGATGGYELSRSPSEITLLDVVRQVEGVFLFSRCLCGDKGCSCGRDESLPCAYRDVFAEISEKVCGMLERESFERLITGKKTDIDGE